MSISIPSFLISSNIFVVGVLLFFAQAFPFGYFGFFAPLDPPHLTEFYIICGIITALSVFRHKENIKRLLHGEVRPRGD